MNLTKRIESAEFKYRHLLEEFFSRTWGSTILWSHDLDHHRRVWQYGKELLAEAEKVGNPEVDISPDELIVACYLHDLGMSIDTGVNHGIHSSHLCRKFLSSNRQFENEFRNALAAIENHDKKGIIHRNRKFGIETFLTAADDLDAFGYIGIYRYLEIYLLRGISKSEVGYKIMENARGRFAGFITEFGKFEGLCNRHNIRFKILENFFDEYNRQVPGIDFNISEIQAQAKVVNIVSGIIRNKEKINDTSWDSFSSAEDNNARDFFINLLLELKEFKSVS